MKCRWNYYITLKVDSLPWFPHPFSPSTIKPLYRLLCWKPIVTSVAGHVTFSWPIRKQDLLNLLQLLLILLMRIKRIITWGNLLPLIPPRTFISPHLNPPFNLHLIYAEYSMILFDLNTIACIKVILLPVFN